MTRFANENAYDAPIRDASARYGVPVGIIKGVIAQESQFNPNARRGEPAIGDASLGLMQVLQATARGLGYQGDAAGLLNPAVNIAYGTKYLAQIHRTRAASGDWAAVISAYNGGYRPELAFGRRATKAGRVCLARDQRTGACIRWYDYQPGEFGNQPHVDKVLGYARTYGWVPATTATVATPPTPAPTSGTGGSVPLLVVIPLGLLGLLLLGLPKLLRMKGGG